MNFLEAAENHYNKSKHMDAITCALIAIAEINEGRLTNEIEMTARLHILCEQLIILNRGAILPEDK
jgi:hypothetical protein